jgi:hypothetical protein
MDREHLSDEAGIARCLDRMAGAVAAEKDDMPGGEKPLDVPPPCRRDLLRADQDVFPA